VSNPLRAFFDFNRKELPVALLLFMFFFLSMGVFQILKPLKKGLFVEHYGADIELYAKLGNIAVAALAVVAFSFLFSRLQRQRLIYVLCLFFVVSFLALIPVLQDPSMFSIWGFYFLGDLVTTLMVAAFWAYSTDLSSPDQAKRLFGPIGAGGVIGGWMGSSSAKLLRAEVGQEGLLLLSAVMMAGVMVVTFAAERSARRTLAFRVPSREDLARKQEPAESKWKAALEGASLVVRSRYLAAIVGIVALYEVASQVADYQFTRQTEGLSGVAATQAYLIDVYFYANLLAVVVQLFLVSLILRKAGLTLALLILPLALMGSSAAFLVMPTMFFSSLMVISDNGLNYSLQQTARESLYVVTSREAKYKARAFTNMFVQRTAKGIAILSTMAFGFLGVPVPSLSLVTILMVGGMILLGIYAGRRFYKRQTADETSPPAEVSLGVKS
jgi:ATP:ADP antiporter, AAA family